jgi:hypothetical protein
MTTKANTKVVKTTPTTVHAENKAIKLSASEIRAVDLGKLIKTSDSITLSIDSVCQAERKARKGKEVGTAKSGDAFMVRLKETLIAEGYAGESDNKLSKCLTEVRKAINEGKPFKLNSYDAKRTGAKTAKSSEVKPSITIKIEGAPKVEDVAKAIREAINADTFREAYSDLAAYLVDALDEFEGI